MVKDRSDEDDDGQEMGGTRTPSKVGEHCTAPVPMMLAWGMTINQTTTSLRLYTLRQ